MQGVIRNGVGRRIESEVWKHFRFDAVKNQSQCLVMLENTQCNKLISGKNTTNLKNHLQSHHKELLAVIQEEDRVCKHDRKIVHSVSRTEIKVNKASSIENAFKKTSVWAPGSAEAIRREKALENFIIATGHTTCIVEEPSFLEFCSILDAKFTVPGMKFLNAFINRVD